MVYLYLLLGASSNAFANFFLKLVSKSQPNLFTLATLKNPNSWLAIICFGISIVGCALFLQKVNLNIAYPTFVGSTFIIVLLLSFLFLHEDIGFTQILGIALIFGGIILAIR
jgi:multidrug transporter EmrE-like cation transporter